VEDVETYGHFTPGSAGSLTGKMGTRPDGTVLCLASYLPCPFWRKANNFRGLFVFLLYYVATINTACIEKFP